MLAHQQTTTSSWIKQPAQPSLYSLIQTRLSVARSASSFPSLASLCSKRHSSFLPAMGLVSCFQLPL